jgi:hypothetical protein
MSRSEPRTSPTTPGLRLPISNVDDHEARDEDADREGTLCRLFGAATRAIVALALASALLA